MFYTDPRKERLHINLDHVKTIKEHSEERNEKFQHFATFNFTDGSAVTINLDWFGVDLPGPLIASPPGYFLVTADKGELTMKQPILAWVPRLGGLAPITIESHRRNLDPSILQPDGSVLYPYEQTFENIEAWLEDSRTRAEEGDGE